MLYINSDIFYISKLGYTIQTQIELLNFQTTPETDHLFTFLGITEIPPDNLLFPAFSNDSNTHMSSNLLTNKVDIARQKWFIKILFPSVKQLTPGAQILNHLNHWKTMQL